MRGVEGESGDLGFQFDHFKSNSDSCSFDVHIKTQIKEAQWQLLSPQKAANTSEASETSGVQLTRKLSCSVIPGVLLLFLEKHNSGASQEQ